MLRAGSYRDWRGVVYPAARAAARVVRAYAERFDTVEINNTFYRLPTATTVEQWAAQAPPGFVYAVKVGQFGSHRMKLRDPATWLPNHLERLGGSAPSSARTSCSSRRGGERDAGRLDEFLSAAPRDLRWAVELRDPTWLHDDVFDVLERHGAALCIHDLLPDHPWMRTTDWTYVRFHGPNALAEKYLGRYGGRRLWRRRRPARAPGSTRAATSTPTSTTTTTARGRRRPVALAATDDRRSTSCTSKTASGSERTVMWFFDIEWSSQEAARRSARSGCRNDVVPRCHTSRVSSANRRSTSVSARAPNRTSPESSGSCSINPATMSSRAMRSCTASAATCTS